MADVTRRVGADRGQLLLLGALALAVVFLVLALLLNSVIYSGTVATSDRGTDPAPAIEYEAEAAHVAETLLTAANADRGDEPSATFASGMRRWETAMRTHGAATGTALRVRVVETTPGATIARDDPGSLAGANDPWLVASEVRVRDYVLAVDPSSLAVVAERDAPAYEDGEAFGIVVDDGERPRVVYLARTGEGPETNSTIVVAVVADGEVVGDCTRPANSTLAVDLTAGLVDGAGCEPLDAAWTSEATTVTYRRGLDTVGSDGLVVDRSPADLETDVSDANVHAAIYDATLTLGYRRPTIEYERELRIAPGEPR
ncbi:DUF7261 family protein [Haloferacaceae archaeon DSL9]